MIRWQMFIRDSIREVLIGLSCSEIKWNKKFIGIFDNDTAGKGDINKGFEKDDNNEKIKHVKYKDAIVTNNFYAFLLPKTAEYKPNESFTIENCYPPEKYQEAVEQAVAEKHGYYSCLLYTSITIRKFCVCLWRHTYIVFC